MATLDGLPPEIQTLILEHHSSLESLYAHIRASPRSYQIFLTSKANILSKIVCRMLTPDVFPFALAAVEGTSLQPYPAEDEAVKLINRFKRDLKRARLPNSIPLETLVGLCQLHWVVEDLIKGFVARCESFSARHRRPLHLIESSAEDYIPLSSTEQIRIRRAFYTLHLYGCASPMDVDFSEDTFKLPAACFLRIFPLWQIEELACIHDYLFDRICETYNLVEDHFIRAALAEASQNCYSKS